MKVIINSQIIGLKPFFSNYFFLSVFLEIIALQVLSLR